MSVCVVPSPPLSKQPVVPPLLFPNSRWSHPSSFQIAGGPTPGGHLPGMNVRRQSGHRWAWEHQLFEFKDHQLFELKKHQIFMSVCGIFMPANGIF